MKTATFATSPVESENCDCENFALYATNLWLGNDCYRMEFGFPAIPGCNKKIVGVGLDFLNVDTCLKQTLGVNYKGNSYTINANRDPVIPFVALDPPILASDGYQDTFEFCLRDSSCPNLSRTMTVRQTVYFDDGSKCIVDNDIINIRPTNLFETTNRLEKVTVKGTNLIVQSESSIANSNFDIVDLRGLVKMTGMLYSQHNSIAIENLPSGAYIFVLKLPTGEIKEYKFVIQR